MSALPLALIEEPAEKFVRFTLMYSPFDMADAEYAQLVWAKEKPLASYLDGLPTDIDWVITVNGMIVTEDEFASRTLTPEDLLLICPLPHGGGGGKQIFRIVALIAIAILAPYAAAGIATLAGSAGAVAATATTAAAAAGSIAAATAGLGVVGFGLLSASIVLAGSLLVNTLLPPPTPKVSGQSTFDESPTYGVDGAKNTSAEGIPVPLVYGEHQVAGNIASLFTENEGDTQIVYVQSILSEGPIESITNVQLNDQAISVYENVTTAQQLGDVANTPSTWFNRSVTMKSVSLKSTDAAWITQITDSEIDQFRVDVTFSSGLFSVNSKNGNLQNASVQFAIEYRKQGTSSWTAMVDNGMVNKSTSSLFLLRAKGVKFDITIAGTPQTDPVAPRPYDIQLQYRITTEAGEPFGEWQDIKRFQGVTQPYYTYTGRDGRNQRLNENPKTETVDHDFGKTANVEMRFVVTSGSYTIRNFFERGNATNNGLTITASRRNPVRASFYSPQVPEGVYEVRLKRTTAESTATTVSDQAYWSDLAQIVYEEVAYKNTAWLGIRAKLSDQFNGIPKITSTVRGIKCRRYNMSGQFVDRVWTQNPAWITLDILIDDDHGAGLPLTRIDVASFARWAAECDARNFKFNGVFDYQSNFWDALQTVCRVGHAQILQTGTIYSIVMEKADDPVMVFSDANIISGSLNLTWLPIADRANEVEVTYIDKDDGYRQRMIRHFDPEAQQRGERPKTSQVSLQGVTNADQAWFEAHFMLAQNKYVLRTAQWDTSLEAIGCTIGDVVLLQTSMMHWATAGRLAAGSAVNTLMLDRPVTMETGKSYKALVHKPAMLRHTATTVSRNTTLRQVTLTGVPVNPERLTRMTIGRNDYEIIYVVSQGGGQTTLQLDRVTQITSGGGQTALLYDTDVIMESNVVTVAGDNITALTLVDGLPAAPEEFSNFLFGESTLVKQPFRVIGITGSHEYVRTIKAAEYNASIYADPATATPLPTYRPTTGIPPVNDLTYGVRYFLVDRAYQARITLNWNAPAYDKSVIVGADIWTSQINGDWEKVATVNGTTYAFTQHDSDDLYVRVVPFPASSSTTSPRNASRSPWTSCWAKPKASPTC